MKPITQMYRLLEWPVKLVNFLERFDAVHELRTRNKLAHRDNRPYLQKLLQQGVRREQVSDRELLVNLRMDLPDLNKPWTNRVVDKKYDIAGPSFQARHDQWNANRASAHTTVRRLFNSKMNSVADDLWPGNLSVAERDEKKAAIVDNVLNFAGLKR